MTDTSGITHLGSGGTGYQYSAPRADTLETFEHRCGDQQWVVGLDCSEFTSLCPITGQPDFGRILIRYVPGERCLESKSLKLYLGAFRNEGAFHESCVNRIADDLSQVLKPRCLRVLGDFRPRGGIAIVPMAFRFADELTDTEREVLVGLISHYDSASRGI